MSVQFVDSNNLKCKELLNDDQIRFAGIINKLGNLIAGGFKDGISPFMPEEHLRMMYMQMVLEISMRKDFDASLGEINYITALRNKALMISLPIDDHLLLISAEPTAITERLITKALRVFGKIGKSTSNV